MHTGMLWFAGKNDTRPLAEKIQQATEYYAKKYGRKPDLCLVHPSMMEGGGLEVGSFSSGGLTVRPHRPVLPGHIWVGIEDK